MNYWRQVQSWNRNCVKLLCDLIQKIIMGSILDLLLLMLRFNNFFLYNQIVFGTGPRLRAFFVLLYLCFCL